jgi:CxxC motif-containing protein (DUF1111 family)
MNRIRRQTAITYALALLLTGGLASPATNARAHGDETHDQAPAQKQAATPAVEPAQGGHKMMGMDRMSSPDMPNMHMPSMNPTRGRRLFVSKGCVACHAINGVGGHDATNLPTPCSR